MRTIKLIATDVDGVLTDAGMYYGGDSLELKKFNTRDGMGIKIAMQKGIHVAIITQENTPMVERRAKKLGVPHLFQGIHNKRECLEQLCKQLNISLNEVAYIGDDINDLEVLKSVGLAATPMDAQPENLAVAHFVCRVGGGQGCVRELIDLILESQSR